MDFARQQPYHLNLKDRHFILARTGIGVLSFLNWIEWHVQAASCARIGKCE
jgi:hypothetical protein